MVRQGRRLRYEERGTAKRSIKKDEIVKSRQEGEGERCP
jgi:hypothetical protein